jgi:HlyD family secretion protein
MANRNSNGSNGSVRQVWLTPLIVLLILFLGAGAYFEMRPHRIRISVVKPTRQSLANSITTNGKVEPIHNFEAHAPVAGTVQKVLVKEGAHVKAGDLLLVLDDSKARSDLALAQTRLKAAKANYATLMAGGSEQQLLTRKAELQKALTDRDNTQRQLDALKRLQQRGAASTDEVAAVTSKLAHTQADLAQLQAQVRYSPEEQAHLQAEIEGAKASVELAEGDVRSCNVHAPFDGTVYSLPARLGAWVNAGDMLLQEADLSQLRVRAFVDEPEIGRLALGQKVTIEWDALPGHAWQGQVTALPSTVINRGSRVVGELLCEVDNSEHLLLPNVDVNATIIAASRENTLTIPREAVRDENGHDFVFVVKDLRLERREVKLGISNLTRIEVLSGVSLDDTIAVQSYSPSPMTDGVAVKVMAENPLQ